MVCCRPSRRAGGGGGLEAAPEGHGAKSVAVRRHVLQMHFVTTSLTVSIFPSRSSWVSQASCRRAIIFGRFEQTSPPAGPINKPEARTVVALARRYRAAAMSSRFTKLV